MLSLNEKKNVEETVYITLWSSKGQNRLTCPVCVHGWWFDDLGTLYKVLSSGLPFKYTSKISAERINSRWTTKATKYAVWPPLKEKTPGLFKDFSMLIIRVSLQVSCIKSCPCLVLLTMSFLVKNLADRHTAYFLILFWVNTTRYDKGEGILGLPSLP